MARVGSRFKKIFEEAQQHPAYKKAKGSDLLYQP